eukprot:9503762-Pyramimonas_sp.AAC.1
MEFPACIRMALRLLPAPPSRAMAKLQRRRGTPERGVASSGLTGNPWATRSSMGVIQRSLPDT